MSTRISDAAIIAANVQPAIIQITQSMLPAFVFATGLTSTDSIPLKISHDGGNTSEAWFQGGSAVVLSPTNKGETIIAPMTLVVLKVATVAAVAIYFNSGADA